MRSLEQCTAEVFRRSEQKIQKRKQMQKAMLTCCIPLTLCALAVLGWLSLPGTSKDSAPEADAAIVDGASGTVSETLQIRSKSRSLTITEITKITQILYLLETPAAPEAAPENFSNSSDYAYGSTEPKHQTGTILEEASETLQFTYSNPNGTLKEFSLTEHMLTDLKTGNTRTLTNQQLEQLIHLLETN